MLPVRWVPDRWALAAQAADLVAEAAAAAVEARGLFSLAVSGGRTPVALFAELAGRPLPWDLIHLFQVDERVAPDGDADRNLTSLLEHLLVHVDVPPENVHVMAVTASALDDAAGDYAKTLARVTSGVLDLVHLGLGDDGHTASWPPGDPVLHATTDVAVVGPYRGRKRMTLTPPAVNRSRRIVWLIEGTDKREALDRLLAGDPRIPASAVRRDIAVVLTTAGLAPDSRP